MLKITVMHDGFPSLKIKLYMKYENIFNIKAVYANKETKIHMSRGRETVREERQIHKKHQSLFRVYGV